MNKQNNQAVLMTSGPITSQIIRFAFPVFLGNLFQQLYNTFDSLIVGKFVGDDALAAVSSSGTMIWMMVGLIFGIFAGAGVVIAQYFGAEDYKKVHDSIHTTIAMAIIFGLSLVVLGITFSPQILRWIHTPENVLPNSVLYFRIYFAGGLFNVLYNAGVGIFQAVGDSKHPLYYLIASSITNIVLDLLFVGLFGFGIAGAALATVISQGLSATLTIHKLCHSDEAFRLNLREVRIHKAYVTKILRVGIPSGIQNSVIGIANIIVQANINSFGSLAMAGCGAYSKIEGFAFLPITSFAMALTTFTGQNIGAQRFDRAKKGALFGILGCIISAEIIGFIMYIFAPSMVGWFSDSPDVVAFGVRWAHITTFFYFLLAFSHAAAGIMRGAGKAIVPMVVMLAFWCVIRVAYITIITRFIDSIDVVLWAYPLTWSLSSITFAAYLISGKWLKSSKI